MFELFKEQKLTQKQLAHIINVELEADDGVEKDRTEILKECLNDDEVGACRDDLESALLSQTWRIYDEFAKMDEKTLNIFYDVIDTHIRTFASVAVLTKFYGYQVAEYTYQWHDDLLLIDKIYIKDPANFEPKQSGQVVFDGQNAIDQNIKFCVLKSRATQNRPKGEMALLKIYPAVLLRKKSLAYAGQFVARYAQPYVVGRNGGLNDSRDFVDKLFGFLNGGAMTANDSDNIEIHQLSGNGEAFVNMEKLANARIQKSLLGKVKNSELSNSSRSAQEVDNESFHARIGGYMDLMAQAIQHALNAMLTVNNTWGRKLNHKLWFEFQQKISVDIDRANRDKLYENQIEFTEQYYLDKLGLDTQHFKLKQADKSFSLSHDSLLPDFNDFKKQVYDEIHQGYMDGLKDEY